MRSSALNHNPSQDLISRDNVVMLLVTAERVLVNFAQESRLGDHNFIDGKCDVQFHSNFA